MTLDEFDAFCAALPASEFVEQWGGAHVWKIGGKLFAAAWPVADPAPGAASMRVTFKVSPMAFDILSEAPGCIPAPHLASRGMKWIQVTGPQTLDDAGLREHILESRRMAIARLTGKARAALGLEGEG